MVKVKSRHGESFDQLLRRFNKAVISSGILKDLRDRSRYEKPSEVKTRRKKERDHRIYLENKRNKL